MFCGKRSTLKLIVFPLYLVLNASKPHPSENMYSDGISLYDMCVCVCKFVLSIFRCNSCKLYLPCFPTKSQLYRCNPAVYGGQTQNMYRLRFRRRMFYKKKILRTRFPVKRFTHIYCNIPGIIVYNLNSSQGRVLRV